MLFKCKGKIHSRIGHEGPEGIQVYISTVSLTSALDRGVWSTPCPGRFSPGKELVPFVKDVAWAPGPVRTGTKNLMPHWDSIPGPSSS